VFSSDLPGVNQATLNGMILYYRLVTKESGLGDSTKLSQMGCHMYLDHNRTSQLYRRRWPFVVRQTILVSFC
jgi:hypothetical protein